MDKYSKRGWFVGVCLYQIWTSRDWNVWRFLSVKRLRFCQIDGDHLWRTSRDPVRLLFMSLHLIFMTFSIFMSTFSILWGFFCFGSAVSTATDTSLQIYETFSFYLIINLLNIFSNIHEILMQVSIGVWCRSLTWGGLNPARSLSQLEQVLLLKLVLHNSNSESFNFPITPWS